MEMKIQEINDIKVVEIEGELDTGSAPEAQDLLDGLRKQGVRKILLDLSGLDFISSAGLRVLLATAQELKKNDGDLRVCCLNETVREVFDISGFSTLLLVVDCRAKALEAF